MDDLCKTLLDNVSDAIITTTYDLEIKFCNRTAEQLFGINSVSVIGKPLDLSVKLQYEDNFDLQSFISDDKTFSTTVNLLIENDYNHTQSYKTVILKEKEKQSKTLSFIFQKTSKTTVAPSEREDISLDIVSDTIIKINRLDDIDKICDMLGETVLKLLGTGYISVSLYNGITNKIEVKGLYGLGMFANAVYNHIGKRFDLLSIDVDEMPDEAAKSRSLFVSGKLEHLPGGIYALSDGIVSRKVANRIQKLLKIENVFSIGFSLDDIPYGGIGIFIPKGKNIKNKNEIEILINNASAIIHRKQMEQELIENEKRLRILFDSTLNPILILDRNTTVLYLNKTAASGVNLSIEECIGKTIKELIPKEYENTAKRIRKVLDSGESAEFEDNLIINNEEKNYFSLYGFIEDFDGQKAVIISSYNITEQKKAEKSIRQRELQFRKLIEYNELPMVVTDKDESPILYNRKITEIFGYKYEDIDTLDKWFEKAYPDPAYRNQVKAEWLEATKEAKTKQSGIEKQTWTVTCKDGTEKTVEFHYIFLEDVGIVTMNDITELKIKEQDVVEHNIELERVNAEMEASYEELQSVNEELEESQTELKEAYIQLQESEIRWQFALEGSRNGVWDWNLIDNTLFTSPAWREMIGLTEEDKLDEYLDWKKYVHPDDLQKAVDDINAHIEGKTPYYENEHRMLHRDGHYVWILDRGKVMEWTPDGIPSRMIGTHTNLTQIKKAQADLKESQERFKSLFDNSLTGIFYINNKGEILEANPKIVEMLGSPSVELTKKINVFEFKPLIDVGFADDLKKSIETENVVFNNKEYISRWGKKIYVRYYFNPVHRDGKVVGVLANLEDVTKRREAEIALTNSEKRYRTMAENFPNGALFLFDREFRYDFVDGRALSIVGLKKEHIIGKKVDEVFPKNMADYVIEQIKPIFEGESVQYEVDFKDHVYDNFGVPIYNKDNEIELGLVITIDITERKIIERSLAESETIYRTVAENFPSGAIFMHGSDFRYTFVDGKALAEVGLTKEEIIGKKVDEVFTGEIGKTIIENCTPIFEGKNVFYEIEYEGRIYNNHGAPVKGEHGEVLQAIVIVTEITEKKRAEELIQASEERLRMIFNSTKEYIALFKVIGNEIVYEKVNREYLEANQRYGIDITEEKLIGMPARKYLTEYLKVDEKAIEVLSGNYRSVVESKTFKQYDEVVNLPDGKAYTEVTLTPILDANGECEYVLYVASDVTDKRKAEIDLRLFKRMFEVSREGISISDPDGNLFYVNPAHEELFKRTLEGVDTISFAKYYSEDALPTVYNEIIPALQKNEGWEGEIEVVDADGRRFTTWQRLDSLFDENGKMINAFCFLHDITERKEMENALIDAKNKAEESSRLKTEFLHNMSHELRTPLNSILGFCQVIRRYSLTKDEIDDYINTIFSSGRHLLNIINDVLDISRIEAGKIQIEKEIFSLKSLIEEVISTAAAGLEPNNVKLIHMLNENVPDEIYSDRLKLKQILINLVNNAIKFTQKGYVKLVTTKLPSIESFDKDQKFLHFSVEDTGIGIAENMKDVIFDKFYQIDGSLTREYSGTGVGLTIAKKFVEVLGGKIWVESELEKGSTFHFTIDVTGKKEDVSKADHSKKIKDDNQLKDFTKKKVLIVEDDEKSIALLETLMKALNIGYVVARDGQEGLHKAEHERPDLILMDIQLPKINGLEAVKRIRDNLNISSIPIVALTAHAMKKDREICLGAGCNDYIAKPFELDDVVDIIKNHLSM